MELAPDSQVVLGVRPPVLAYPDTSIILPICAVATSLLWIVVTSVYRLLRKKHKPTPPCASAPQQDGRAYRVVRATSNLALLVLAVLSSSETAEYWILTFAYAFILATVDAFATKRHTGHLVFVNLSAWIAYGYRNLFPLATFTLVPADIAEGPVIWGKIALLTVIAVFIPMVMPREYVPIHADVFSDPAPQQVASWLSLLTYTFVDRVILLSRRTRGHMGYEKLPILADHDHSAFLRERALPHVDPFHGARKGHVFWGLLWVMRASYMVSAVCMTMRVFAEFISPFAVNRLLRHMETGERDSVRPWVWIALLFCGPVISSFSWQRYMFYSAQISIRIEAVITTLVFEHTLRVRMKAETGKTAKERKTSNVVGKALNLVSSDLAQINSGRSALLSLLIDLPGQVIMSIVFLYSILGWSTFVGLAIMAVLFFIPGYIIKKIQTVQRKKMKMTDRRVEAVSQAMAVLRMVKLFGWEKAMSTRIGNTRENELTSIKRRQLLHVMTRFTNIVIPVLTMLVTYGTYTLVMKEELTASKVFSSMTVFDLLRTHIRMATRHMTGAIQAKVSLDRLNEFIHNTELLDQFDQGSRISFNATTEEYIGFNRGASFAWDSGISDGFMTPSTRLFRLSFEEDLHFLKGGLNLVVGPTGCGKSSLLMALLGEMHFTATEPDAQYNLPRTGGIAYAAQESWVQSLNIKDNIVFGAPFDEVRYKKVLYQCALERDLLLFEAGDQTEVGEKGLTLSGGQKARVTLARAIYSTASIVLLDDILAALDVHTARWIIDKCLTGDLVEGRTVIMVTHNVAMCAPISGFLVSLSTDGKVASQGSVSEAISANSELAKEIVEETRLEKKEEEIVDASASKADGKLVVAEEIEVGHVSWAALRLYFQGLSGGSPVFFWTLLMTLFIASELANITQTKWLGHFANQYKLRPANEVEAPYYLGVYTIFLAMNLTFAASALVYYLFGTLKASRSIHKQLIDSVLGTTLRWLDITPTGRIISRCTGDITAVDGAVPNELQDLVMFSVTMALKLGAIALGTPFVILPGLVVAFLGTILGQIYLRAQLPVKREMSNARSPVLSQFGASVAGLVSIRAYGVQEASKREMLVRIDHYSRMATTFYNLNRWVSVRVDILSAAFISSLGLYLLHSAPDASNTGFSLNMAVGFSSVLLWLVRTWNEFEIAGNSLERIKGFIDIEQEPKPTPEGVPPAYWPSSGALRVEKLSARYSKDGPKVLSDISFEIKSGERVGVVGRTGSGKSSLTLSLLRCILTEGDVYFDGLKTSALNLDALREAVTIIPQVPELLSGSLRSNLDPFEEHLDATLNDALRSAGLFSLQEDMDEDTKITLDSAVSSGGGNLSVGQRQILALARAIVRRSKILILDEATSAIDYKTDTVIQDSLRNELPNDVTLLTVAHRLQTIIDADKIMVLDAGRIVEFDTPKELLKNEKGLLRALVNESGDREKLYSMVI